MIRLLLLFNLVFSSSISMAKMSNFDGIWQRDLRVEVRPGELVNVTYQITIDSRSNAIFFQNSLHHNNKLIDCRKAWPGIPEVLKEVITYKHDEVISCEKGQFTVVLVTNDDATINFNLYNGLEGSLGSFMDLSKQ